MNSDIKRIADGFLKKHRISTVSYAALKQAAMDLGYTVIEFNSIINDEDVAAIIESLNLGDAVRKSRGFTYSDRDYRLIFIHEDLTDDEKLLVIAHELGHVVCAHYSFGPIIGKDVKEEHEANEFSHYILKKNAFRNCKFFLAKHKLAIAILLSVAVLGSAILVTAHLSKKDEVLYSEYYITETGNRYHQSECIHVKYNTNRMRMTMEQFESGEYSPCGTCLPQG